MKPLDIPQAVLENLRCIKCKEYLSRLPVISYPDVGIICGRCPQLKDIGVEGRREQAYEIVSEILLFPCRYSKRGCLEQFNPTELQDHEESCLYRSLLCPCCKWEGAALEFSEHCESQHKVLFLKEGKFEVDMLSTYEESNFILINNNFFVVLLQSDTSDWWCTVRYVNCKSEKKFYKYQVEFIGIGAGEEKIDVGIKPVEDDAALVLNLDTAMKINLGELSTRFVTEPASICCKITIVKSDPKSGNGDNHPIGLEDDNLPAECIKVTTDFLRNLECPICSDCMVPPIYQCEEGHSLCGDCKEQVDICPMCKAKFGNTRNFSLEQLTTFIPYTCKYLDNGCNFRTVANLIRAHEADCKYGTYLCPMKEYDSCEWKGALWNVMEHIENDHPDEVHDMDLPINITLADTKDPIESMYMFQVGKEVFKLCFRKDQSDYYFNVKLFGPACDAEKFVYSIDFMDQSPKKLRFYVKRECNQFNKDKDTDFENALVLPHALLEQFLYDHDIQYKCRVTKV